MSHFCLDFHLDSLEHVRNKNSNNDPLKTWNICVTLVIPSTKMHTSIPNAKPFVRSHISSLIEFTSKTVKKKKKTSVCNTFVHVITYLTTQNNSDNTLYVLSLSLMELLINFNTRFIFSLLQHTLNFILC